MLLLVYNGFRVLDEARHLKIKKTRIRGRLVRSNTDETQYSLSMLYPTTKYALMGWTELIYLTSRFAP